MQTVQRAINELIALHAAGRLIEMTEKARTLLKAQPASPILNELLGIALSGQQRFQEALVPLKKAVRHAANDAQFWENLALCQRQLEQFSDAETSLRRSLELRPDSVETLNALGSVLNSLKRHREAETVLQRALAIDSRHYGAHFNLGNTLQALCRWSAALASFDRAAALNPNDPLVLAKLGQMLVQAGQKEPAVVIARRALDMIGNNVPGNTDICDVIATVLAGSGRKGEAARLYRQTRGYEKNVARAFAAYSAARSACDWEFAELIEQRFRGAAESPWTSSEAAPFTMLMMADVSAADQLVGARSYARQFAVSPPAHRETGGKRPIRDRLRVGYLSGDYCNHAVNHLFVGVAENHDREHFEIIAYDYSPRTDDEYRKRTLKAFDRVVSIHDLGDVEAAQCLLEDNCDILVDLTGWTGFSRSPILAARPGAVQVQWLGYPGTLGAPWIDYIVADPVLIRPGEETNYSEKIIRLPHSYQSNDDRRVIAPSRDRVDYRLPESSFVLCAFNQPFKITRTIFETWMKLLREIDGSVLWLLDYDRKSGVPRV